MKKTTLPVISTIILSNAFLCTNLQASTFTGDSVYANTGWNGTHGGPHNDDYSDIDLPRAFKQKWLEFDNNAFEQAIALGRDRNTLYAANGYGANSGESNFVALNQEGERMWEVPAWTNTDDQYLPSATDPNRYNIGFDSCSAVNTAIVDRQGDIYISDCNQLWAFTKAGNVKWSVELPDVPEDSFCKVTNKVPFQDTSAGKVNPLVVPIFTKDGSVGGVTMYGDFVLYDRSSGEKSYADYKINAEIGCETVTMPEHTWEGIFDDELREWYYNWLNATDAFISADTPAVAVQTTGRVFLSAKASKGGNSLWAFNLIPPNGARLGVITKAWEEPLDETGGSSPALNIEETRVSAGTGEGHIKSYDTETGIEVWSYHSDQAAAGSVSTTPDGIVYAVPDNGTAIHPETGESLWHGAELLDSLLEGIPEHPQFGKPIVTSSSIIQLAKHKVLQSVNVGYVLTSIGIQGTGSVKHYIITRNRFTGEIIKGSQPYSGITTMENIMTPNKNGTISLAYGSLNNSKLSPKQTAKVNAMLSSINQQLLPVTGGLEQIEGIDEATIGSFVDGVINEGNFEISDNMVRGEAVVNNAKIIANIKKLNSRYIGSIIIEHQDYRVELDVNQEHIKSELGSHAIAGSSKGLKYSATGNPARVETLGNIDWVIKDWSN